MDETVFLRPERPRRWRFSRGGDGEAARNRRAPTLLLLSLQTVGLFAVMYVLGWAVTHTSLFRGVRNWDESVNERLAMHRTVPLDRIATDISGIANPVPVIVAAALITAWLLTRRRWEVAALIPAAILVEAGVFLVVAALVDRPRPAVQRVGQVFGTSSFPSGHVAATLVLWAGVAIVLNRRGHGRAALSVAIAGAVVVASVGWARLYLGMHHPTDVGCGMLLGAAACRIAIGVVALQNDRMKPTTQNGRTRTKDDASSAS